MEGYYIHQSAEVSSSSNSMMSSSMKLQRTMSSRYGRAVAFQLLTALRCFKQAFLLGAQVLFPGSSLAVC